MNIKGKRCNSYIPGYVVHMLDNLDCPLALQKASRGGVCATWALIINYLLIKYPLLSKKYLIYLISAGYKDDKNLSSKVALKHLTDFYKSQYCIWMKDSKLRDELNREVNSGIWEYSKINNKDYLYIGNNYNKLYEYVDSMPSTYKALFFINRASKISKEVIKNKNLNINNIYDDIKKFFIQQDHRFFIKFDNKDKYYYLFSLDVSLFDLDEEMEETLSGLKDFCKKFGINKINNYDILENIKIES